MVNPTDPGGPDNKAYCFLDRQRVCNGDCVAFDPNGARDDSGRLTSCLLLNDVAGIRAAGITIGGYFKAQAKKDIPNQNVAPPKL